MQCYKSAKKLTSNEDLCADLDICDEEGEINNTHGFCTGEIIPHLPYPPGGCHEGYHSYDDDESGYCYDNDLGCEYEDMIMRPNQHSCGYIELTDCCSEIDSDITHNKYLKSRNKYFSPAEEINFLRYKLAIPNDDLIMKILKMFRRYKDPERLDAFVFWLSIIDS
jgi:hypothetical protein